MTSVKSLSLSVVVSSICQSGPRLRFKKRHLIVTLFKTKKEVV